MHDTNTNDPTKPTPLNTGDIWHTTETERPPAVVIGGVFETEDDEFVTVDTNPTGTQRWLTMDTTSFRETYHPGPTMEVGGLYFSPSEGHYYLCTPTWTYVFIHTRMQCADPAYIPVDIARVYRRDEHGYGYQFHLGLSCQRDQD